VLDGHKSYIQGVSFDPKMDYVISYGNDRLVKVWRKLKAKKMKLQGYIVEKVACLVIFLKIRILKSWNSPTWNLLN